MSFANLAGDSLELVLNGSSHVQLSGKVKSFAVRINGSGDVDAQRLRVVDADIETTGSGDINLTVTGSLNAEGQGSGDVTYWGHPETVTKNVAGSGEVVSGD